MTHPRPRHRAPSPRRLTAIVGLVCALVLGGACGQGGIVDPLPPDADLGTARFALSLPQGASILRVDYDLQFTFLESTPPFVYNRESYSSVQFGGELVTILPCHTGPDGDGMNQVDVAAKVWVPGEDEPYDVNASGVFVCRRNADTLVNITLSVIAQLPAGFFDGDFIPVGTLCAAKVDLKDGAFLGTCPESKCAEGDEVLLFANTCQAVQGANPDFWVCGHAADWHLNGNLANAFFPIPEHDGEWRFGVTALDPYLMQQADPTLTDDEGNLVVWSGASAQRARLVKAGGEVTVNETDPVVFEHAARLELVPREVGQPTPEVLVLVNQEGLGARVYFQTRFGRCDLPALGVSLYPGMMAIDARRDGPGAIRIVLADPTSGLASWVARCETAWDESGPSPQPAVTCAAPLPILSAF
ncbi:MAG: hypothetical protein IT385_07445 [Deltaproteobacteria bacterium]|nr:hypothetical protein [Deltaproteobacteria bacterium]